MSEEQKISKSKFFEILELVRERSNSFKKKKEKGAPSMIIQSKSTRGNKFFNSVTTGAKWQNELLCRLRFTWIKGRKYTAMTSTLKQKDILFRHKCFCDIESYSENIIELPKTLWEHLETMMESGNIISHRLVFNEINSNSKNPDFITKWIANKKKVLLIERIFKLQRFLKL